jgi:hypothetical protein
MSAEDRGVSRGRRVFCGKINVQYIIAPFRQTSVEHEVVESRSVAIFLLATTAGQEKLPQENTTTRAQPTENPPASSRHRDKASPFDSLAAMVGQDERRSLPDAEQKLDALIN